jgi:hypothetical protein
VQPGEIVRAKLAGNAALRLHLVNADGTAYTGHYQAQLRFLNVEISPNTLALLAANSEPPPENLFTGLVPIDVALTIAVPGGPAQEFPVTLAPNETRDVTCALATGIALAGRVLAPDGTTPLAGVDVQLTRGERAGYAPLLGGVMWTHAGLMPHVDQHATSDAQGHFSFESLATGQWTLRAIWGSYLNVDATVDLPGSASPIELVQPANGFLSGHLIVPASAPVADTSLLPRAMNGVEFPIGAKGSVDSSEVLGDSTFHIGPLPVGDVALSLRVRAPAAGGGYFTSGGLGLGTFSIHAGADTNAEIDLRQSFPGRVRAHVVIDGTAATEGFIECTPTGPNASGGLGTSVGLDGTACIGSLSPGLCQVTFASSDDTWAWLVPQQATIQPGLEAPFEIAIFTTARDLRCVDTATGALLANVDIEWRTGLPNYEVIAHAQTDAQGLVHLKMPEQNVELRCVGDTGAFTTIAWSAGSGPLTVALHRVP